MTNSSAIENRERRTVSFVGRERWFNGDAGGITRPRPDLTRLPTISRPLLGLFTWYARRYLKRHFHSVRIHRTGLPDFDSGLPLVIYSNHASWWDPLVGLLVKAEFQPDRNLYAPIDAAALGKYGFFRKLGFFPVEQRTARGGIQFLRMAGSILQQPDSLLAITPQSRFADVRERPVRFESGLGVLASRVERACFVPFAAEYVFWEERLPEILVRFGAPVKIEKPFGMRQNADSWTRLFEARMQANQDELAAAVQRRDPQEFRVILSGAAGQGGVYDWFRSLHARWRGEEFHKEHGRK